MAASPTFFEPYRHGAFVGRSHSGQITVDALGLTIDELRVSWRVPGQRVAGHDPLPGVTNYFIGNDPSLWRTSVPHFRSVRIDGPTGVVVYASGRELEFDFEIPPGASPRTAGLIFPREAQLRIDRGALVIDFRSRQYRLRAPDLYQQIGRDRERVDGRFVIEGRHSVGFAVGSYDHNRALVIDPVLEWLTYYGGSGEDQIISSATDSAGNIYIAGGTTSKNLPAAPGFQTSNPGTAAFVSKLDPSGSQVLYTTYLGGQTLASAVLLDSVLQVVVDSAGNAYLCGYTYAADFPVSADAWQRQNSGAFLSKLDPTGAHLLYSTFLGVRGGGTIPSALAVDGQGNAYVGGSVSRPQFIGTDGAFQTQFAGGSGDGVLFAVNPTGTGLRFGTMLGGSGSDSIQSLALDATGNIIAGGTTTSTDFPVTEQAALQHINGSQYGFLTSIDPSGSHLVWSTYVGGAASNSSYSVNSVVTDGGSIAFCGFASSGLDGMGFPNTKTPSLPGNVTRTGYVALVNGADGSPQWVSRLPSACTRVASDSAGFLYLASSAPSSQIAFQSGGAMSVPSTRAAITMLPPDASAILYLSGIAGFSFLTTLTSISSDPDGLISLAGYSDSLNLATTPGVVQPKPDPSPRNPNGGNNANANDGFAGRLDLSAFRAGNFLVAGFSQSTYTLRVGDPIAVVETLPVVQNGLTLRAAANVPWLDLTIVPGGIEIRPNAQLAPADNATVRISISADEIPGSQVSISARFTVRDHPTFTLDTTPLTITTYSGVDLSPLPARNISFDFKGQPYNFDVTSSDRSWLFPFVRSGTTQGQAQLVFSVGQKPVGTYTGTVSVAISGIPNSLQTMTVTYTVLPGPTMTLSTTTVNMRAVLGQAPATFTIGISSSVANFPFSANYGTGLTWLSLSQSGPNAPCVVTLTADPPANTTPGVYGFVLILGLKGQSTTVIDGTVEVAPAAGISVSPSSVSFTYYRGQAFNITPVLQIVTTQPTTLKITADQTWIQTGVNTVQTPIQVGVAPGPFTMREGVYQGNVFVSDSGGRVLQTVPVTLNLYDMPVLTFDASPISFQYNQGDPPPAAHPLHLSTATIKPGFFAIGTNQFPHWLSAKPNYGNTPADISIQVDPTGLAPGIYKHQLLVQPAGSIPTTTGGGSIPVTLTVAGPAHPLISAVVSAASNLPGAIAPGELVLVYGTGLGAPGVSSAQLQHGDLPFEWNGTSVTFDEFKAPVLFTSDGVIGVSVPFEVAGRSSVQVIASYQANQGPAFLASVDSAAPGVFTADETGTGQASAFLVDPNGTFRVNDSSHPIGPGGTLIVYINGSGAMKPLLQDGSVASSTVASPELQITARIGSQPAEVLFAGSAPGLLAGLVQVNLRIPSNAASGQVPLALFCGSYASQPGTTIAIR